MSNPTAAHPPSGSAEIRAGMRDAVPIILGYIPLGFAYGLYAVSVGLPWYWTIATAAVIYAGSMEFLAASMIVSAAPLASVATTALFVNFRHVFYGLSVPLQRVRFLPARLYAIGALTDEAYAVLSSKDTDSLTAPRMLTVEIIAHASWVSGTAFGALVADVARFDATFMEFSLTALFIILTIDSYDKSRQPALLFAALGIGVAFMLLTPGIMLIPALTLFAVVALVQARVLTIRAERRRPGESGAG